MSDGLIGAANGAFVRLKKADLELVAIFIAMVVGIISVIYYSRARATDTMNYVVLCGIGIAAVIFAKTAASGFVTSLFNRKLLRMAGYAVILAAAYAWDFNAHLAVGSSNQDGLSAIRQAAYTATSTKEQAEAEALEALKTAKRDAEEIRRAGWELFPTVAGKQLASIDAADAAIQVAEAHKFFKLTDGCRETKGPQSRAHCDMLAELKAAKAKIALMLAERSKLPEASKLVADAEARLKAARDDRAHTPVVLTTERADAANLIKLAKLAGIDGYDVNFGNAALFAIAMLIFISVTEAIRTAKEFDGLPRKEWPWMAPIRRGLYGAEADANVPPGVLRETVHHKETITDAGTAAAILRGMSGSNLLKAA